MIFYKFRRAGKNKMSFNKNHPLRKYSDSRITGWDFTIPMEGTDFQALVNDLNLNCRRWTFQAESGEDTGYKHYQGRLNLKEKEHQFFWGPDGMFCTPSHVQLTKNAFYVIKDRTRIDGPWRDAVSEREKDLPKGINYIDPKYANRELWGWQKHCAARILLEKTDEKYDRKVNVVIDKQGCGGKSSFAMMGYNGLIDLGGRSFFVPDVNDRKEVNQNVCCLLRNTETVEPGALFFDLPRAMRQDKTDGIMGAIEGIKNGWVYDTRHNLKMWSFKVPSIWVFMNHMPNVKDLSFDRWVFWNIRGNGKNSSLVRVDSRGILQQILDEDPELVNEIENLRHDIRANSHEEHCPGDHGSFDYNYNTESEEEQFSGEEEEEEDPCDYVMVDNALHGQNEGIGFDPRMGPSVPLGWVHSASFPQGNVERNVQPEPSSVSMNRMMMEARSGCRTNALPHRNGAQKSGW